MKGGPRDPFQPLKWIRLIVVEVTRTHEDRDVNHFLDTLACRGKFISPLLLLPVCQTIWKRSTSASRISIRTRSPPNCNLPLRNIDSREEAVPFSPFSFFHSSNTRGVWKSIRQSSVISLSKELIQITCSTARAHLAPIREPNRPRSTIQLI